MLKRFSHTLLALVIFVATTGMTISTHYCGGNVKDVSFLSAAKVCCDIPNGCCQDDAFTVKIEDDFSISSYSFDFNQLEIVLPILIELIKVEAPIKAKVYFLRNTIPPPKIQTVLSSLQTYLL
ncbi:HYC_CC_PP family protein [Ancylomarina sp. YFZ004]